MSHDGTPHYDSGRKGLADCGQEGEAEMTRPDSLEELREHISPDVLALNAQELRDKGLSGIITPQTVQTPLERGIASVKGRALVDFRGYKVPEITSKYHVAAKEDRTYNNVVYDSKKEMERAILNDQRIKGGDLSFWLYHVRFPLPGGTWYELDFMEFRDAWRTLDDPEDAEYSWAIEFIEVKGYKVRLGEIKRKQTEEIFGIHIEVV